MIISQALECKAIKDVFCGLSGADCREDARREVMQGWGAFAVALTTVPIKAL